MSELEFECPYCNEKEFIETEGMGDGDEFEIECQECKKIFIYWITFSVDTYTMKIEEKAKK